MTRLLSQQVKWDDDRGCSMSSSRFIHEGKYAADVQVDLDYNDGAWGLTLSPSDVQKLERVRTALLSGNIKAAAKEAKVFELIPLTIE